MLCFECVTANSTCRPEPGRKALTFSLRAPAEFQFSLRQKWKFWRFEWIAGVCFVRVARCSIPGIWRFNLAEFAGRETGGARSGGGTSGEITGAIRSSGQTRMAAAIPELLAAPTFSMLHIAPFPD